MINIKRDTIIKTGDIIVNTENNEEYKVSRIEGMKFYLQISEDKEFMLTKFDMLVRPNLKLRQATDRGYH